MEIQTKAASLDTLSVTIQALHVDGKQMTLAVFRQLPIARAYNDDGSLAPFEFWGLVRYPIKNQGELWAVGASGGRLYRCDINWTGDSPQSIEYYINNDITEKSWVKYIRKHQAEHGVYTYPDNTPRCFRRTYDEDYVLHLEQRISEASSALANARRAEIAKLSLENLPQLFISV